MSHDISSKKVAVLTGLTMLVGGVAEVSDADAATTTETLQFSLPLVESLGPTSTSLSFSGFNSSLGTLDAVLFDLDSTVSNITGADGPTATVSVLGQEISSQNSFGPYAFSGVDGTAGGTTPLASFTAPFLVGLQFSLTSCTECQARWIGDGDFKGLTATYDYTPVPLPAALPLFASGLAGLGFINWRNRRKQKIK